jgi:5'-deoxynucleotidase YfbR-like HD superfamily hydrolase
MTTKNQQFHDPKAATDGVFNTCTGKLIDLNNPSESLIEISDIANALSQICRFGGHTRQFYSVAQHSCLVAGLAPKDLKKEALLHDAAEAYLGDVIKPLKILIEPLYAPFEFAFQQVINQKFGLLPEKLNAIKRYDLQALELEHKAFIVGDHQDLLEAMKEADMEIFDELNPVSWAPWEAGQFFLQEFYKIFPEEWEKVMADVKKTKTA